MDATGSLEQLIAEAPAPTSAREFLAGLGQRTAFGTAGAAAVSGGADSTALVVLAVAAGLAPEVHHVNHGLRAQADAEAENVAALSARLGLPCVQHRVEVEAGRDVERAARRARLSVLPAGHMTGHTLDDQAETVLLGLGRGSGVRGLAAMRSGPSKPLLRIRRAETRRLCSLLGLDVAEDPMNADPRFRRPRVRMEVLPLLDAVFERDVSPIIASNAELLWDVEDLLDELAGSLDPTDAHQMARAPRAVAAQALRRFWAEETGLDHPPGRGATERMLAVVRGEIPRTDVVEGWRLSRSQGRLRLVRIDGRGPDRVRPR